MTQVFTDGSAAGTAGILAGAGWRRRSVISPNTPAATYMPVGRAQLLQTRISFIAADPLGKR
jgi:hypothetical protein